MKNNTEHQQLKETYWSGVTLFNPFLAPMSDYIETLLTEIDSTVSLYVYIVFRNTPVLRIINRSSHPLCVPCDGTINAETFPVYSEWEHGMRRWTSRRRPRRMQLRHRCIRLRT